MDSPARPGDLAIALGLVAFGFAYFSLSFPFGLELRDEGYLYGLATRVAAGAMPHRDFSDIYGPGVFWLTGGILRWADGQILVVRIVLAVIKALAVGITYALGRRVASRPIALLGALLAIAYWGRAAWKLNAPYASMFSLPLALLALLVLLGALRRGGLWRFVAAGSIAGLVVLFKQSIGLLVLFGFGLTILASALLTSRGDSPRGRSIWLLLAGLGCASVVVMIPFQAYLSLRDYALHLGPLHAWMVLIGVAGWRWGGGVEWGVVLTRRLIPLGVGAAIPLLGVALLYLSWGAFTPLMDDMFVFQNGMINYYDAVSLPSLSTLIWLGSGVVLMSGLLFLVARRFRAALMSLIALAGCGIVLAVTDGYGGPLRGAPDDASGIAAAVLVTLALLSCVGPIFHGDERLGREPILVLLALALFQCTLVVQIYPRAGFKILLIQAAMTPLLIGVLGRFARLAGREATRRHPWRVAACVSILPLWMAWPAVVPVVDLHLGAGAAVRTLDFDETRGLRVTEFEYRSRRMADFERLVRYLRGLEDAGAPLLLLSNQAMVMHLSGHPNLFADRQFLLSFVGWERLPRQVVAEQVEPGMIERLRERPDALVIERAVDAADRTPRAFRRALPKLYAHLDTEYEEVARFGVYRVLAASRPDP